MESNSDFEAKIQYTPMRVLDKQYYFTDIKVSRKIQEGEPQGLQPAKNTTFLMVLDRSGSMCGGPWKALVEGAEQVATRIYEHKEFDNFLTIFFNNNVNAMPTEDLESFKNKISKIKAMSTTNFSSTFKKIQGYCQKKGCEDLTVLFLTDGNDTCNTPETVQKDLENMKEYLNKEEITSRFFTIGLSKHHDAVLLSKIAQAGSELGNFFYVDYD